jgi:hypothetical protein
MSDDILSKTIELLYPQARRVTSKRFPTEFEKKILRRTPNKMVVRSELTTHNELEIKMYNAKKEDFVTVKSGGNYDFKERSPPGTVIDIKMKHADDGLKSDINEISRELCKTHLRPGVCYLGVYSTRIRIDYFVHTKEEALVFVNDFTEKIKKRVKYYDVGKSADNAELISINDEPIVSSITHETDWLDNNESQEEQDPEKKSLLNRFRKK